MNFRYVAANAKLLSSVVNTLRDCVPEYLHNRPHWFIWHCIKQIQTSEELSTDQAVRVTDEIFQVCPDIELHLHDVNSVKQSNNT